jgi:glyoxylase-like metal-dependent hydrolase (beta-lactamase superfamily II)
MLRVRSILGNEQRLDGGACFGNAPRAVWSRWSLPDERNRIVLACRCLLVEDGSRRVLLEAGIGAFFAPKLQERFGVQGGGHRLLAGLERFGLEDADIDVVVLSHLHFDHAGGLLAACREGEAHRLLFPRARFIVSQAALERARAPHPRDRASYIADLPDLLEASGRLEVVDEERRPADLLDERYRFVRSDGHTPGMLLTEVVGSGGRILYCADLIPGVPWMHLPITMGYDRYPERLVDEKAAVLQGALDRGTWLAFAHDPATALATVGRDERGRFGPADERNDAAADLDLDN